MWCFRFYFLICLLKFLYNTCISHRVHFEVKLIVHSNINDRSPNNVKLFCVTIDASDIKPFNIMLNPAVNPQLLFRKCYLYHVAFGFNKRPGRNMGKFIPEFSLLWTILTAILKKTPLVVCLRLMNTVRITEWAVYALGKKCPNLSLC